MDEILNVILIKIKNIDGNDIEIQFNLQDSEYTLENLKEYILINFYLEEQYKPSLENIIIKIKEFEIGEIFENVPLLEILKSFNTNQLVVKCKFKKEKMNNDSDISSSNDHYKNKQIIIKNIEKEIHNKMNFYQGLVKENNETEKLIKTKKIIYDKKKEEFLNKKDELNIYIDKIIRYKLLEKKAMDLINENQKLVGKIVCQKIEIEHKEKEQFELERKMKELIKSKEKETDLIKKYLKK